MVVKDEVQQKQLSLSKEHLKKKPFTKVVKRDGKIVKFEQEKITKAICKAGEVTGEFGRSIAEKLTNKVTEHLHKQYDADHLPEVEKIQNVVEHVLMDSVFEETAKAYIVYRKQHEELRKIRLMDTETLMDDYIGEDTWYVRENANMSYSLQGLRNFISDKITEKYWLNKLYPAEIKEAHENADFHIHDLGFLAVYCCGWDLKDLLLRGFGGVPGKIQSRPAKHLKALLNQVVNFMYTVQGESAGAVAFSNFDTLVAPFVRFDNLDYKQVKQAMQEFVYGMNIPTRVGFQTPFTNITMDLNPAGQLAEESVIIGGKPQKEKYKDFQEEMDLVNQAFAEVMLEGDANGRIFSFPIPTYNITKDFNWDNDKLNPVWEMTAKYGIPYFSNFVNSDMSPDDARSMCCRLRLDNRELRKRGGGLFGSNPLTGSIGVVTINMARLGYVTRNEKEYLERLDHLMDLAKESLEIKRKVIERFMDQGLYPFARFYLEDVKKRFGCYWANHFSTIGLLGMNESVRNLFNDKENITTKKGHEFAIKVMNHMRERMSSYQEETGNMYNLEATPGEGTTTRFAKRDKEQYNDILVANEEAYKGLGANPYYTNSTQLPVNYTEDIFEALDLQDGLQTMYTGGTVLHIFVGERLDDINSVKNLVKKISENYHLPYFTLSPTFSVCPKHGYLKGEHKYCPVCDQEIGYLPQTTIDINIKQKVKV
ncbi:MAG: ribonucleoside triphosphate reductase [Patescibacteria group bacterium]|nr:ribonucleoside triphosphate reductase [Patescibacteria group bacterium]